MIEGNRNHKGESFIRTALVIKCFLMNEGKKLTYEGIGNFLTEHGCRWSNWMIGAIVYHASAVLPIEEGRDGVKRWYRFERSKDNELQYKG